jgi:hypothetical protein
MCCSVAMSIGIDLLYTCRHRALLCSTVVHQHRELCIASRTLCKWPSAAPLSLSQCRGNGYLALITKPSHRFDEGFVLRCEMARKNM